MKLHQEKTAARKSLPLNKRDLHDLSLLTGSYARRSALFALVDVDLAVDDDVSEAQVLHAIVEVGLRVVSEQVEEESYASDAVSRARDEDRQASARRRRPEWATES